MVRLTLVSSTAAPAYLGMDMEPEALSMEPEPELEPEPEPELELESAADAGWAGSVAAGGGAVLEGAGAEREPLALDLVLPAGGGGGDEAHPRVDAWSAMTLRNLNLDLLPSREQIRSKCADAALLTTGLFLATILVSVVWSLVWGLGDGVSGTPCSERTCMNCEKSNGCMWRPGPHPSMPGYCEEKSLISLTERKEREHSADTSNCTERRSDWDACVTKDESACNDASSCEWCGGMQQSCVLAEPPGESFCLNTGAVDEAAAVLSSAHRACQSSWVETNWTDRRKHWIDRSALDNRSSTTSILAADHTYHTQISCVWLFECGFDETVEVTVEEVKLDYNSKLTIDDGATQAFDTWGTELAYFDKFSGDRHSPDHTAQTTAVSGSPSSHKLQSTGPVMTVRFTSGATEAQTHYTRHTGNISFPSDPAHDGFKLKYTCVPPTNFYGRAGFYFLGVWALAIAWFLSKAYHAIRYSAKTGGLWKMNEQELCTLCEAMDQQKPPPDPETVCKGELISRIIQSDRWPKHELVEGLALSSFEDLETDDTESWIDISWHSPYFLIDCVSCIACTVEGLTDLLFLVMQLYRPNGAGFNTAIAALMITLLSTFMYLAPPGTGLFGAMVFRERFTFRQAKTWVWHNARTLDGQHLRTRDDWKDWLQTPAGKHRPAGLGSELHNDYRYLLSDVSRRCGCKPKTLRKKHAKDAPDPSAEFKNAADALGKQPQASAGKQASFDKGDQPQASAGKQAPFDKGWTTYAQFLCKVGEQADENLVAAEKASSGASEAADDHASLPSQLAALATTAKQKVTTKAGGMLPETANKAVGKIGEVTATVVGGVVGGVGHGVGVIGNAVKWKEEDGSEPGWLCGRPPQTKWDSDYFQMVYGRPSAPLMYICTILQCRVAVEGMIAWRNIATLKAKRTKVGLGKWEVISVREKDFLRARRGLDMALLREGIFEALPQSVLEFQNLFRDKYTVLDLMSIPGVPVLTFVSEYQLTFAIMMVTVITATLDITTPYSTDSVSVGMSLYVSQLLQLWSRLLVIGSVFSMHQESATESNDGLRWGVLYMIATYLLTMAWFWLSDSKQWFHAAEAAFRRRRQSLQYIISVKTAEGENTGTKSSVSIKLEGTVGSVKRSWAQPVIIGSLDRATNSLSGEAAFAPGNTIHVKYDEAVLDTITHLDIGLSKPSDSWRCSEIGIQNCATRTFYRFDTSDHQLRGNFDNPHHLVVEKGGGEPQGDLPGRTIKEVITQEYAVTFRSAALRTPQMKSRVQIKFVCAENRDDEEFEPSGQRLWEHREWLTLEQSHTAQHLFTADSDLDADLPISLKVSPPIKFLQRIELRLEDDYNAEDHKVHCESVEVFDYSTNKTSSFFVNCEITRNALGFPRSMQTGGLTEGMDMLNMQAAGKTEKALLFGLINLFTCTDRNLCTPPTSKAALVLSFLRILESGVVCAVFVPVVCSLTTGCGDGGQDGQDGQDGEDDDVLSVDRVSAFEIKSFLAVYLSVCSFACLLAGSAAEKLGEYNKRQAHDQKISWSSAIQKVKRIRWLVLHSNDHMAVARRRKLLQKIWCDELTAEHKATLASDGVDTLEGFQRLKDKQVLKASGIDVEKRLHETHSHSTTPSLSSEDFQSGAEVVARGGVSLDEDEGTLARCMRKGRQAAGSCKRWKSNMTFLYFLAPLLLAVMFLCGVTLYYVYVRWMEECRSVVLLSLVVAFGMTVICVRLALGKEEVWLFTNDSESEVKVLLTLLAVVCVGAVLLGATDTDVAIGDLGGGLSLPFKFLTSRCHSGDAWRSWRD